MEDQGRITVPPHCSQYHVETLPATTINKPSYYPCRADRTLPAFANIFGFHNVEDIDENGKNIFHHLLQAVTYSSLAVEVVLKMLEPNAPVMKGNYARAMQHQVEDSRPEGWTPLHCLCNGSDKMLAKKDIIEKLLEEDETGNSKFVPLCAFDSIRNAEVIVSCSLNWVPTTPSDAESLPPTAFKCAHMCTCVRTCAHMCAQVCPYPRVPVSPLAWPMRLVDIRSTY